MRGVCMKRRQLLTGLAGLGLSACTRQTESTPPPRHAAPRPPVELHSFFDLPADDVRSKELSGIAWDPSANTLWAVQDESPLLVGLLPDPALRTWRFGQTIEVSCDGTLD